MSAGLSCVQRFVRNWGGGLGTSRGLEYEIGPDPEKIKVEAPCTIIVGEY